MHNIGLEVGRHVLTLVRVGSQQKFLHLEVVVMSSLRSISLSVVLCVTSGSSTREGRKE